MLCMTLPWFMPTVITCTTALKWGQGMTSQGFLLFLAFKFWQVWYESVHTCRFRPHKKVEPVLVNFM